MSGQNPAGSKSTSSNNKRSKVASDYGSSGASTAALSRESQEVSQKKELLGNIDIDYQSCDTDSGFLSGPLSSNLEEQEEQKQSTDRKFSNNFNKLNFNKRAVGNVKNSTDSSHHHGKTEEEFDVLDSGCIEEEEYDESIETGAQAENQYNEQQHTESQQHQHKCHNIAGAYNITSSHDAKTNLKHDADSNRSDRFCSLSLQKERTNIVNASGRVATVEPVAAATTKTADSNQLPIWEQNDEGDTYLHLACLSGDEYIVCALIRLAIHSCLLNIRNDYGQTALHLAALTKQRRISRMLLLAGAEPDLRDRHGNTALHLACMSGDEQCVSALTMPFSASEINEAHRQNGYRPSSKIANVLEIRNYNGEYCVHIAAEAGHLKILSILVQHGADINAREGKGGYTPLHMAIEKGNDELFNFLLDDCKQTLNLETSTFARLTAYQFACILKRSQMESILENHGAEPLTPPESESESSGDESE
ncbi:NF-kappa-B inhibitor cactus-like [Anastrepha obliqua]|uniref:NF-kappa-B inhibitor cactus-like n=1 Tax=Anastrepha obliqua TaxID=95512 RepID=UPI0024095729|nr:NF-kappa-B inhibitor cactus-like [Anastrepha obliqua]